MSKKSKIVAVEEVSLVQKCVEYNNNKKFIEQKKICNIKKNSESTIITLLIDQAPSVAINAIRAAMFRKYIRDNVEHYQIKKIHTLSQFKD